MSITDIMAEFQQCQALRQADIDGLRTAGVPAVALVHGSAGQGLCLCRDRVEISDHRFEFERHRSRGEARAAFVLAGYDRWGDLVDLVSWAPGADGFTATWLGQVGMLGEHDLDGARLDGPLHVHADVLSWLRAGREGLCVVDPARAGPLLRSGGTLQVDSHAQRRRLIDTMTVRLPQVMVRPAAEGRRAA